MSLPLISLYSGTGGLDLGFALNGFSPSFANDVDVSAKTNYLAVMRSAGVELTADHFTVGDLSHDYTSLVPNEDAVLVGGPPCQGFSRAGRMNPSDPRSEHVRKFITAVFRVRPAVFVMENVKALGFTAKWRPVIDDVRFRAESLGYDTVLFGLNAKDFGVAQSRERMFLVGTRRDTGYDPNASLMPSKAHKVQKVIPVRTALGNVVAYRNQDDWQKNAARIVPAKRPVLRVSPFAGMFFNGQGRLLDLDAPAPTMSASLGGNHTPIVDQNWLDNPSEQGVLVRAYHAALRAGESVPLPGSWRRLSLLEAAEIQSFPTGVDWSKKPSISLRHIGNAVPPRLAAEVAARVAAVTKHGG